MDFAILADYRIKIKESKNRKIPGLVLWHINHCWLFNANSCFYVYIKYMICKHIFFRYTQLNDETVLIIQFSIVNLFAFSLNVKQFYLTHR